MIQRKQTLFLLLAVALVVATLIVGGVQTWVLAGLLVAAAAVSLVAIFTYQKRLLQARLCLVAVVLLLGWYVALAVQMPQLRGDSLQLSYPDVLPMLAAIFVFMARKGVLADERLVRSMDRIR